MSFATDFASLTSDLRARASYLPFCPLCSNIGVDGYPDSLTGPTLRQFRGQSKIVACCALSATEEAFDTPASASAWWRAARLQTHRDPATDSRRLNTLAKLAAANLEPIV